MEKLVADEMARPRTAVAIATLFAFMAIFVAAVGVYAVFLYETTHRARELAVHSAVGATRDARRAGNIAASTTSLLGSE